MKAMIERCADFVKYVWCALKFVQWSKHVERIIRRFKGMHLLETYKTFPISTDRGAIFGLRGPNAELPTGRETSWGSEFTGLRQQQ